MWPYCRPSSSTGALPRELIVADLCLNPSCRLYSSALKLVSLSLMAPSPSECLSPVAKTSSTIPVAYFERRAMSRAGCRRHDPTQ